MDDHARRRRHDGHPSHDPDGRDRAATDLPRRGAVTVLEQTFRDQWGRVLAALIGFLGDFDLAEDATQEALAIAAERWPRAGIPQHTGTSLVPTARHSTIDRIRRNRTLADKLKLLDMPGAAED